MKELFAKLSENQHYEFILFGIKTFVVFFVSTIALVIFVKNAWIKLTWDEIYNYFIVWQTEQFESDVVLEWILEEENIEDENVRKLFFSKNMHWAGDDLDIETKSLDTRSKEMCDKYKDLCDIIIFEWDFDENQKNIYKILSLYFLGKIDENLNYKWKKLSDWLTELKLRAQLSKNKSEWPCYTERRWCADRNTVMLNLELFKSYKEYANVLVHEIAWHIVDLWIIQWESNSKDENFTEFGSKVFNIDDESLAYYDLSWSSEKTRKKWASKEDFCSLYAMTTPFEDFAECVTAYKNNYLYFKVLAQENRKLRQKFKFIDKLYKWKYVIPNANKAIEAKQDLEKREWDLTKI